MANIVYIATSLDGFIAAKDGGIDWLMEVPNPDGSDYGFAEFMNRIDAILMGRNTFETAAGFDMWIYTKKVFVLSSKLKEIPERLRDKAELVTGSPGEIVDKLGAKGYRNLYIDGGKTINSFLAEDMIDELIITTIPIVLGDGIPLFERKDRSLRLEHISTDIFHGGLVKSRYRRR